MPIVDGIDTKGDEKTVLPTRFLELENVVFTSPGSLRKRYGYDALPNRDLGNNIITTGSALSNFRDELLLYSNNNLYSFSEAEQKWEGKGEIKFCNSSSLQISADNNILENPSSATYENVTCYAYEKRLYNVTAGVLGAPDIYDEYKNIIVVVVDNITNTILARHTIGDFLLNGDSIIGSSYLAPKVGFTGSKFVVAFYANTSDVFGGGLRFVAIDFLNPKIISLRPTKLITRISLPIAPADFRLDLISYSNKVFIAYQTRTLDTIIVGIDNTLVPSAGFSLGTNYVLNNVSMSQEGPNLRILLTGADGLLSKAMAYLLNYTLSAPVHAATNLTFIAPNPFGIVDSDDGSYTITGVQDPLNAAKTIIYLQSKNWKNRLGYIKTLTITSGGIQDFLGGDVIGMELQSKPVVLDGYVYFFVSKNIDPNYTASGVTTSAADRDNPDYQANKPVRTLYLIKNLTKEYVGFKTELVGQYDVDQVVFRQSDYTSGLANCTLIGSVITIPAAVITSLQPAGAARVLASTVIKKLSADFSQSSNYFDAAQGEALHISGGLLKMYDGYRVVEHSFLDSPDAIKDISPLLTSSGGDLKENTSSGVSANKRYLYCIVYKWTDRTGKVHRSAPSLPVALTTPSPQPGGSLFNVTIRFIPCYLTSKEDVEIEVYRTQGNATIFYKLSMLIDASNVPGTSDYITGSYPNNKLVRFIAIKDSVTDNELAFAEPLYTTGGELENDAALSSSFVASYKARLFLILSDGFTLQYSKVTGLNEPVRFNAGFKIPLDDNGGKATALAVMDDHLLIFKERAIFALTGEGPNALGQQDDYRTPYLVTSDAGCVDANSIVQSPEGIMFKSSKGIYMIKRNFGLQYIGDSVEKFNDLKIVSSTLLSTSNQIRLMTESGVALVYDYYCNRWTTFTNITGLDSIEFKGAYHFVRPNGLVYKEVANLFQDNGQFIKMRIKSAWLQIAGVQGFERFYQLMILGTWKSAHKLLVKFSYDFNPYYQQESTIEVDTIMAPTTFGAESPYGAQVYGGEFPLYQWLIYPKIQKCQSFQFELQDVKTSVDGESFSLSHIMAEIGVKQGSSKTTAKYKTGAK